MVDTFSPCFLIPCYNHGHALSSVVEQLLSRFNYPIIIVDDGSNLVTKEVIRHQQKYDLVSVVTLAENQGKGGAVIAGFKQAAALNYSHALQVDADGQHDLNTLPKLIEQSQLHPQALISGRPIYDESVPKGRLYGRYITHVWVWIETLSFSIKDTMCGFRSYPVQPMLQLLNQHSIGKRMDFDTEIMVKHYWLDGEIRFIKTQVVYPEDGVSHFNALHDNIRISWMHTRLFFGMLPRIPHLLTRRGRLAKTSQTHWSQLSETGSLFGIKILLAIYSVFGRRVFKQILKLVMAYYARGNTASSQASSTYLINLQQYANQQKVVLPETLSVYKHLYSFALTMLDKLAAWRGDFSDQHLTVHGEEHVELIKQSGRGVVILGSHLGNLELCRALSKRYPEIKINALMFTEHAQRFQKVLKAINKKSELNIIQVNKLGPETAIMLDEKIEQGEWVVIVGDRTSTTNESRVVWSEFLGKPAPFPQGPFTLAAILKSPVYLLFGLRNESKESVCFDVHFEPFKTQIQLPRKAREQALQQVVDDYAQRLQHYTMKAPLQWYNFFNFWQLSGKNNDR